MARQRSFDVAAINIAMHPHSPSKYVELFQMLSRMRVGAAIRGEYQAMVGTATELDKENPERGLTGEVYKFFELDPKATWFSLVRREAASDVERSRIRIPTELKPHFTFFYYVFFPRSHRFFYECQHGSNQLTPGAAAKMFKRLFERPSVVNEFGGIDVTVEPAIGTVDKILAIPRLRNLHIELTRPNADDLAQATKHYMERLKSMNASRQEMELKAERGETLKPDEEIRTLARVAQSNGYVEGAGYSGNKPVHESTEAHPYKERVFFDPEVEAQREALIEMARKLNAELQRRDRGDG